MLMLAPTSFKTALCCPACLRAAERAKAVAQERAAVRLARERLSKRICERLDAPYAGMSYDDFLGKFEAALIKTTMRSGEPVTYRSRNKRYTFWWHLLGKRLLVKVGWLGGRKSRRVRLVKPDVEALAARMAGRGACRLCGASFDRNGTRRKFCSDAHAARHRKLTWQKRKQWVKNAEERQAKWAEGQRMLARIDARQQQDDRARRAAARRRRRERKRKLERMADERKTAPEVVTRTD